LKDKGWNLQQVQAFIPTPMTLATAMYWTGIDPMSKAQLFVAKDFKDRKLQQALLQPHKPGNREIVEKYQTEKRRNEITADSRAPKIVKNGQRPIPGLRRSLVDVPKGKLGRKLLLDSR
jgi:radical SAM superfamily enzyme YgiQ (UPF0313 family)